MAPELNFIISDIERHSAAEKPSVAERGIGAWNIVSKLVTGAKIKSMFPEGDGLQQILRGNFFIPKGVDRVELQEILKARISEISFPEETDMVSGDENPV